MRLIWITFFGLIPITFSWQCGNGRITNLLSFVVAAPFDKYYVNNFCRTHDKHYEQCEWGYYSKKEADYIFCDCLNNSDSWWTRWITRPIFCSAVKLYTWWHSRPGRRC